MTAFFIYNLSMADYTILPYRKYFLDESIIIHTTKITPERSNMKSKQIVENNSFDISFYSIISLKKLLKEKKVTSIIFFTYQSYYDILLNNLCKFLNIKRIFHDHGIVTGKTIAKGGFNFYHILRYSYAKIFRLVHYNINKYIFKYVSYNQTINKFISFDCALVFCKNNFDVYTNLIDLNDSKTVITGVPIFIDENEKIVLSKTPVYNKQILYIHQPLYKFGFTKMNYKDDINYILRLNNIVNKYGYKLKLRFHPTEEVTIYEQYFSSENISISKNNSLSVETASSEIVLGHWSTAILAGSSLGKKVYILKYPLLHSVFENLNYIFRDLSCKHKIFSLTEFEEELSNKENDLSITDNLYLLGVNNTFEFNYDALQILLKTK